MSHINLHEAVRSVSASKSTKPLDQASRAALQQICGRKAIPRTFVTALARSRVTRSDLSLSQRGERPVPASSSWAIRFSSDLNIGPAKQLAVRSNKSRRSSRETGIDSTCWHSYLCCFGIFPQYLVWASFVVELALVCGLKSGRLSGSRCCGYPRCMQRASRVPGQCSYLPSSPQCHSFSPCQPYRHAFFSKDHSKRAMNTASHSPKPAETEKKPLV